MPIPFGALRDDLERALGADSAARAVAIASLESRGLAALPAIEEAIAGSASSGDLEALARRLSFIVAEAVLAPESAPADPSFHAALQATVGKSFTGLIYVDLLRRGMTERPPSTFGLRVVAKRLDASRGVTIEVTLYGEPAPRSTAASPGIRWCDPVVHRRGERSFGGGGWSSSGTVSGLKYGIWNALIHREIDRSELDDEFVVDGRLAWER
jgi:hypothetical protein